MNSVFGLLIIGVLIGFLGGIFAEKLRRCKQLQIDFEYIHNSVCEIDNYLNNKMTEQQHYDIELICQNIARNEKSKQRKEIWIF